MKNKIIMIRDIAGFCPEEAVWKMIADISMFLMNNKSVRFLSPESIIVDGNTFIIAINNDVDVDFLAPEHDGNQTVDEKQLVWTLAALAYYMALGHIIFGGHGGKYQKNHPLVSLPVMPKDYKLLTPVMHKCLCSQPDERIGLNELHNLALKGLACCEKQERVIKVEGDTTVNDVKYIGDKWPEEMMEI